MKVFDYKIELNLSLQDLNKLGDTDWELVTIIQAPQLMTLRYYLKKEVS